MLFSHGGDRPVARAAGPDQTAGQDAVAIVGLSCRLPGAADPPRFWELLRDGRDALSQTPLDRWPGAPRLGGFLDQVRQFDPAFFGISPREAAAMDPQQRLMLELSWEAVEDAGTPADRLRGAAVGVFFGAISVDYAVLLHRPDDPATITEHSLTGLHRSLIANRVSYQLGLRGPSMVVDTGQSSSLVAVHLAAESIRRGDCCLALAGGVNLNLAAESTLALSRFGVLSPDGRCFTFDARANGYARGEGGGVAVLKPLAQAVHDGDQVYCVVLGSAVNNDGGGQSLTAPDQRAQEDLLRHAYRRSGLDPAQVQYVELHGSATKVGDPVEAAALGAVLGTGRPAGAPLLVGSAKTNVGHLEGAAGIVGLLKAALAIRHGLLPPSLNFESPNPEIDLPGCGLRVQTCLQPWPDSSRPRVAGVSSFGLGGTNCHVVLAEPPPAAGWASTQHTSQACPAATRTAERPAPPLPVPIPWVLSARGADGLRGQAERLLAHLQAHPEHGAADVGWSLACSRAALDDRAVLLGDGREALLRQLAAVAAGEPAAGVIRGVAAKAEPVVFVFPGQGGQWAGMAADLLDASPVFAGRIAECGAALSPWLDWSPADVLRQRAGAPELDGDEVVQPLLWAVMVSLAALWRWHGVQPAAVLGHSQGEIAAACVSGALSLQDAAAVVALRAGLLGRLASRGGMASVWAPPQELVALRRDWAGRLTVAAVNGPSSAVFAGGSPELAELIAACEARGLPARLLPVGYPSHSAAVEAVREPMLSALAGIAPRPTSVPMLSTVTGRWLAGDELDAEYWYRNLRQPVELDRATRLLAERGHRVFLEVGPHPVLAASMADTLREALGDAGPPGVVAGTLRRGEAGPLRFLTSMAQLHVAGVEVDWSAACAGHPDHGGRRVPLPTYAFQRQPYWPKHRSPQPLERRHAELRHPGPRSSRPAGGDPVGAVAHPGPDAPAKPVEAMAPAERGRHLLDLVRAHTAATLGHATPSAIDPRRTFRSLGLDSVAGVELRDRLGAGTGLSLPATAIFDHPTAEALASHLAARLGTGGDRAGDPAGEHGAPGARPADGNASTTANAAGSRPENDPVAIVAMACRLPGGVHSPEDFWQLLASGMDAVGDFPTDRGWDLPRLHSSEPALPGTSCTRSGGFLDDVAGFDCALFGISPREALAMDPQHRLLLEESWVLLERAGIDPATLRGSRTGVFVGLIGNGYGARLGEAPDGLGGYLLTGTAASVASGRIAYTFGFEGPAITVDTACSSSLVALHLATQALRRDECRLALAGGVAVMATPGMFVEFTQQRGLAPDGRCKAFAAAADGTGWAEGAGLVLLERLSQARRNGHPVLAVVAGTAVNQDGASNGLTAPNGRAQRRVIRQALADARLRPDQVDVVEGHGTGTTLGDPIEAAALLATYGRDRPADRPVWLGSVKSNIGHTQAAAGVAGVIKLVLALRHALVPRTLHIDAPSPHADWDGGGLRLVTEQVPWPDAGGPRRGAVSSFGISGTNAHMIIEQAPPAGATGPDQPNGAAGAEATPVPCVLSGHDRAALRGQAARLLAHAGSGDAAALADVDLADVDLANLGWSLATTRARLEHRAVVIARDHDGLVNGLAAVADGATAPPNVITGVAGPECRLALLFPSGAGPLLGMGRGLYRAYPAFAGALDEVCSYLDGPLGRPVTELLLAADPAAAVLPEPPELWEAALFAVEIALLRLVQSLGVRPDAVLGHGVGEVAAAQAAGELSLADAAAQVAARLSQPPAGPDRFAGGLHALWTGGLRAFLVLGPDCGLSALVRGLASEPGHDATAVTASMLLPGHDERFTALHALGRLHVAGVHVDWRPLLRGPHTRRVPLPTYAFQRRRFWLAPTGSAASIPSTDTPSTCRELANGRAPAPPDPGVSPRLGTGALPHTQPAAQPTRSLTEIVIDCVAEALQTDRGSVPLSRPLPSAGMDSLAAMDVTVRLRALLRVDLPVSSVLAAKALPELVGEIEQRLAAGAGTREATDAATVMHAMESGEV